nr:hypothetical protein [Muribaculaceae bacterium]
MKQKTLLWGAALLALAGSTSAAIAHLSEPEVRFKVQGVPHRAAGDSGNTLAMPEGFSFDDVKLWTGDGDNKCAVVVQWNKATEDNALVFGYRWDGNGAGIDALMAIANEHPQFYIAVASTNYGYTICGIGWDADGDGVIGVTDGTNALTPMAGNPRVFNNTGGYGYDDLKALDPDDLWCAGWY